MSSHEKIWSDWAAALQAPCALVLGHVGAS